MIVPGRIAAPIAASPTAQVAAPAADGALRADPGRRADAQSADATDGSLLGRIAGGDRDAHRQLYERHGPAILAFLVSRTADRALAEDVLHDVMLTVWRAAGTFRGASAVRTWLLSIAHHTACKALRRHRREQPLSWAGPDRGGHRAPGFAPAAAPTGLAPDARVELAGAVAALPEVQRTALVLHFYHGLSVAEIAAVVGVPAGTVKSRMSRGKERLRALLAPREVEDG